MFKGFPQWKLFQKPDLSGPVSSNTSWTLLASWIKPLIGPPHEILTRPTEPASLSLPCLPDSSMPACLFHHMHTRQASQTLNIWQVNWTHTPVSCIVFLYKPELSHTGFGPLPHPSPKPECWFLTNLSVCYGVPIPSTVSSHGRLSRQVWTRKR